MDEILRTPAGTVSETESIANLMSGFTVETTPVSASKIPDFREILRPGTTVYITLLPGTDYHDTIELARRLRSEGFEPAPHIAARAIRTPDELNDYVERVTGEAGVDHVLAIAGAGETPAGVFTDSMQLLETGVFDRNGITKIGVAGHPEGSPDMSDEAIQVALAWKNQFSERTDADMHLVTQFCFEAGPIIAWDKKINASGNRLPIQLGAPGVAKVKTLLNYAMACGIGNSMQFIKKQASNITRLLASQAPDRLIRDLARYAATDPDCGIHGVHMYPLGGLAKTAKWSYAVVDGKYRLSQNGGMDIDADIQ